MDLVAESGETHWRGPGDQEVIAGEVDGSKLWVSLASSALSIRRTLLIRLFDRSEFDWTYFKPFRTTDSMIPMKRRTGNSRLNRSIALI